MTRRRLALVLAMAGISLITPYTLAQLAKAWPNSPLARLNTGLHAAES